MAGKGTRWKGPGGGAAACRAPVLPTDLEDLELDHLEDDDGFAERAIRGAAVAADAERVGISRSTVTGVRLAGADLHRLELVDVAFANCDLAGVVLGEASLNRVSFTGCRFSGADLGGARLTDVRFTDCQLDDLGLRMVVAERLAVSGGTAERVDLYRARLAGSSWQGVDLTGADLSGADLARARLHGSTLVDLTGAAALRGTVIDGAQVVPVGLALIADAGITVDDD